MPKFAPAPALVRQDEPYGRCREEAEQHRDVRERVGAFGRGVSLDLGEDRVVGCSFLEI